MVTLVLFHPAAFAGGATEAVTPRGVFVVNVAGVLAPTPATFTTTETAPLATPEGTGATIAVAVHDVGVACTLPNLTVLAPCVVPKFEPAIVTTVPIPPELGVRSVMVGVVTVGGRISTVLRLYITLVGAVSLIVT